MLETRFVTSKCDKCQQQNDISLSYFVGSDYKFENTVIAMCQNCNSDFLVTLDEAKIQ